MGEIYTDIDVYCWNRPRFTTNKKSVDTLMDNGAPPYPPQIVKCTNEYIAQRPTNKDVRAYARAQHTSTCRKSSSSSSFSSSSPCVLFFIFSL